MNWVEEYAKQIEKEKMTSDELWHEIRKNHWKAFGMHADKETDVIIFGDNNDCGYADFNHHTGELIVHEFSPYCNPGEGVDEIYKYQAPVDIYRRVNFLPTKLYQPYQDMLYELLPVVDLFINKRTVDVDYDAKPDGSLATYRIEPSESAQRGIDAIYTAEFVTDTILKETISNMTSDLTLPEARKIVNSWIRTFGEHKLVLLYIPSGTTCPEGSEFPYILKNVLEKHYEDELNTNQDS